MYYTWCVTSLCMCHSKKEDKVRNLKSPKSPKPPLTTQMSDGFLLSKPPASSQDSDVHITVLCLKALMNNSVSCLYLCHCCT